MGEGHILRMRVRDRCVHRGSVLFKCIARMDPRLKFRKKVCDEMMEDAYPGDAASLAEICREIRHLL